MIVAAAIAIALLVQQAPATPVPASAHVAGIRVRGNHTTPDDAVMAIAAVPLGSPFQDDTIAIVTARLDASHRFRTVEVLKRFESLSDPSAILLVIVVEEKAAITVTDPDPSPMRKMWASTMWLPVLRFEDGYGFTYGARVALVDVLGPHSRLSAPLTWGGERRATAEFERTFEHGPLSRIDIGGGIWRRENPAFDTGDTRTGMTMLADRAVTPWLRVGATGSLQSVQFGVVDDSLKTAGVEATVDTRRDPAFPRNAVYVSVGWEHLWFDHAVDTSRFTADVRGFIGLFGQTVLALRVQESRAADPLPAFEQALLGGTSSLRGFALGFRSGDRLASGTVELRVPISSPRHFGRTGIAVFADAGTIYDAHTTLDRAEFDTGVGAGWFLQLPVLSFRLDVAHGLGGSTRAHVTLGVSF